MIYLDNAATTFPKPREVTLAVNRFMLRHAANPGRSGHRLSLQAAEEVYRCREAASGLFHAEGPECVAFFMNATQAINAALKGALIHGGHVITSSLEHNAVMRPLTKLSQKGVSVSVAAVDADDAVTVGNFKKLIRPDTVMIACTHASNVCGKVLPVAQIGELCRQNRIMFLVDASQSAGVIPIDVSEMGIDFLCLPGHKGLYGPMGTGMLITSRGAQLDTILEGGTGSNSVSMEQPDFMPDRLESGTLNAPGIAGLLAGIRHVEKLGQGRIFRAENALALRLYDSLADMEEIRLYTPRPENGYVPVISFNIGGASSVDAVTLLDRRGFALRGGLHCSPAAHACFGTLSQGTIRVSFGTFNSKSDVTLLISAIRKIKSQLKDV